MSVLAKHIKEAQYIGGGNRGSRKMAPLFPHTFDPPQLALLYIVFDELWIDVEAYTDENSRDRVRDALAKAVLHAAEAGPVTRSNLLKLTRIKLTDVLN